MRCSAGRQFERWLWCRRLTTAIQQGQDVKARAGNWELSNASSRQASGTRQGRRSCEKPGGRYRSTYRHKYRSADLPCRLHVVFKTTETVTLLLDLDPGTKEVCKSIISLTEIRSRHFQGSMFQGVAGLLSFRGQVAGERISRSVLWSCRYNRFPGTLARATRAQMSKQVWQAWRIGHPRPSTPPQTRSHPAAAKRLSSDPPCDILLLQLLPIFHLAILDDTTICPGCRVEFRVAYHLRPYRHHSHAPARLDWTSRELETTFSELARDKHSRDCTAHTSLLP